MLFVTKLLSLFIIGGTVKISEAVNVSWTNFDAAVSLKFKYIRNHIIMYGTEDASTVILSKDNGLIFSNITDQFLIPSGTYLKQMYVSDGGQNVIFTDEKNNVIFASNNCGQNFTIVQLNFTPSVLSFYGGNNHTFLVLDERTKILHYTNNFGETFGVISERVTAFEWQMNQNLYVETQSSLYHLNGTDFTSFHQSNLVRVPITDYRQFSVVHDFLFVLTADDKIVLSYQNGPFIKTDFFPKFKFAGFHVAAFQENSFKLSLVHPSETRLYSGNYRTNATAIQFVLSLRNIVTDVPEITSNRTISRTSKASTQLYTVKGHIGVHIANVYNLPLYSRIRFARDQNVTTVVSMDNGGTWKYFDQKVFGIQAHLILAQLDELQLIINPDTRPSMVIAYANNGELSNTQPHIFMSNDYGEVSRNKWHTIFYGYYKMAVGANGGIIVAVKTKTTTKMLMYSTDNGYNWKQFEFNQHELNVTDLLTNGSHCSTIFHVIAFDTASNQQMIVTIDFNSVVTNREIILNRKRWAVNRWCIVGAAYKMHTCYCHALDFECDHGYYRNNLTEKCQLDQTLDGFNPMKIQVTCKPGDYFHRSKGYRKIESSICHKDDSDIYSLDFPEFEPQRIACPVERLESFLIFSTQSSVHTINLVNSKIERMPVNSWYHNAISSVDFDLANNCIFFASGGDGLIVRQCLDGYSAPEILVKSDGGSREYTSLSYDGVTELLYYIEPEMNATYAVRTNQQYFGQRISVVNSPVEKPRQILVDPLRQYIYINDGQGFWRAQIQLYQSNNTIRLRNSQMLLNGSQIAVTVDFETQALYIVGRDFIQTCDKTGNNCSTIVRGQARFRPRFISVDNEFIYLEPEYGSSFYRVKKRGDQLLHKIAGHNTNSYDTKLISRNGRDQYIKFMNRKPNRSSTNTRSIAVRECTSTQYKCITNECIPQTDVCNGKFDCQHGDDENYCDVDYQRAHSKYKEMLLGMFGSGRV